MKKEYWLIVCMFCLLFVGCSDRNRQKQKEFQAWIEDNGKVKILSTTGMIDDLVKQIAGEYANTLTLIQGDLDPHSYQLVKGDDEKLAIAQIVFYNGLGLEHGPSLYRYLIENPNAVPLGDLLYKQDPSLIVFVDKQKDPHVWMDISLWAQTIPFIVKALSEKDPVHASIYEANGIKLKNTMLKAHDEARALMQSVPSEDRFLVTSHDAFNYFTRAYLSNEGEIESGTWNIRFSAPEGLAPESQLSVNDIKKIIEYLKLHHIRLIFPESNVSRQSIKKIIQAAQEQGVDVQIACCALYGDAMGPPGSDGDTYLKMIVYNAKTLSEEMLKLEPVVKEL